MSGSCWHCWMKRCGIEIQMMQADRLSAARIVIVDDVPANVRLLEGILQHAGGAKPVCLHHLVLDPAAFHPAVPTASGHPAAWSNSHGRRPLAAGLSGPR